MAHFDLPPAELQTYRPAPTSPPDFAPFWIDTLTESAQQPLDLRLTPLDLPYTGVRLFRSTYAGWRGAEVVGTYATPVGPGPFPAIATYHGYTARRPEPFDLLSWVSQGYAVLATDVRGQGGESSDAGTYPGGHAPGFLTLGLNDPYSYYYRGVYVDALRAVEVLAAQPEVAATRIGLTGVSQGGGITLAAAALAGLGAAHDVLPSIRVGAAVAEVPFLCHFARAATLQDAGPYQEIGAYCRRSGVDVAQVFRTLSYFDGMNLAAHIQAPTLVTVGLMDTICPPSTIFAAYNHIRAPKEILIAYFGEHATFPGVLDARARWFGRYLHT